MFQGTDYIFALQTKDYKFWKVVNNKVTVNAHPYLLNSAPPGWEDITVQNVRNRRYWAVDRSVSAPLTYVNDGAQILKYILLNKGHEEPVFLAILEQQLEYQPNPNGILEFTTGQSPFTPNDTATGTITAAAGSTVYVKFAFNNAIYGDTITGNFDSFGFSINHQASVPTYTVIVPATGIINFSITFTQAAGSTADAGMALVNSLNNTIGGYRYWYKMRSRTELDLTTYSHEGSGVKVNTLEDGFAKYLKANENATLELPFDDAEAIYVKADGIKLKLKGDFAVTDGAVVPPKGNHSVNLTLLGSDGYGGNIKGVERVRLGGFSGSEQNIALATQKLWFYYGSEASNVKVQWDFYMTATLGPGLSPNPFVQLFFSARNLSDSGSVIQSTDLQTINGPDNVYKRNHFTGTATCPCDANSGLYLVMGINIIHPSTGDGGVFFDYDVTEGSFKIIDGFYRKSPTYIKAFRPQYLFKKYVDFVGEGNYSAAVSSFFAEHKNIVFTSGMAIRLLTDALLKWSFSGFFQFWDCFTSAALSEQNGTIDLDERKKLTGGGTIINLSSVSNVQVKIDTNFLFNELEHGYPAEASELGVLNGNECFNTKYLYSLGMMKKTERLDKVSKIVGDPYPIERVRIQTLNKDTTDYKNDNDVFPLVISDTLIPANGDIPAHYELDRSLNATATGLLEPATVFNIALSPHLNMKRNGPYYRSCFFKCDQKTLKYLSSDKNNKLQFTDPVYGNIIEKADENLGNLGTPFFTNIQFIVTGIPDDNYLDAGPLAEVHFPFLGTTWKCISMKDSSNLAGRKAQTWELLALPGNDFKLLENYYG